MKRYKKYFKESINKNKIISDIDFEKFLNSIKKHDNARIAYEIANYFNITSYKMIFKYLQEILKQQYDTDLVKYLLKKSNEMINKLEHIYGIKNLIKKYWKI